LENEVLVRAAKRGDHDAFYKLIQVHKITLYKIAFSFLNNEEDALEAVQEVTCRMYIKINKLKEPRYFKTWLIRIMINYCSDELKKRKRTIPHDFNREHSRELLSAEPPISMENLNIENALKQLEPKYNQVIQLKYLHDLTIADIARILNCPEGTVKTWLNKALKRLRAFMKKEGETHASS
jgi:RNA polymerase sigma-70 factor (TIGR02954 family)